MQYGHTAAAYENAGLCALAVPDIERAKLYFSNALKQDPDRRESLYELVKLESKLGNDAEALKQLQKYPEMVLNDRIFLFLAKDIALKAGNQAQAIEYENKYKAIGINTDNSGVDDEHNNHSG